jgi:osmotically-inducible protein OsmY
LGIKNNYKQENIMHFSKIVLPVVLSLSITGCAPLIVGGAATAGYLAIQERGAKTAVIDSKIKTHIKDRLFSKDYHYLTDIGVNVLQGNVLLTGVATDEASKENVERITRLTKGVNNVANNILVADDYTTAQYTKDSWISTQFKTRLLGAKDVYSVNYLTDTVMGNIYILGIAATESEKERVLHIARTTKGVQQVFNYIQVSSSEVN